MRSIVCLLIAILLCYSCASHDEENVYPKVQLKGYNLIKAENLKFTLYYNTSIYTPGDDHIYNIAEINFGSEVVDEKPIIFSNKEIEEEIRQSFVGKDIYIDSVMCGYLLNKFVSAKITCDKLYRDELSGNNLNRYFAFMGSFAFMQNNGKYKLVSGEYVLNSSLYQMDRLLFPNTFGIKILNPPFKTDIYSFYIELIDNKNKAYKIRVATVNLSSDGSLLY